MARPVLIWGAVLVLMTGPIILAAFSPYLVWRDGVYIIAGFAGIAALALMLTQPLLAAGLLPGLAGARSRQFHRLVGAGLLSLVAVHVIGLWVTSPPDVIDAMLFRSPTPFSAWGVLAMWALILTAGLALLRRRLALHVWRRAHGLLAIVIVGGTALHAVLIEGAMEVVTKWLLCMAVVLATGIILYRRGTLGFRRLAPRR